MLKIILTAVAVLYAVVCIVGFFVHRRFIYHPDPTHTLPADAGLPDIAERIIETPDGEKIVAWYAKAKPGQPTLLYFHGNGGSLERRSERFKRYIESGRGLYVMSYRGYSGSTGSPSEAANVADAKLAYDALLKEGVKPEDIILYGESLGTGVAVQVAEDKKVAGVVLDSPFTSVVARAAELYPWLPIRMLLKDRYESIVHVKDVHVPLFILHGEADEVVPVEMGRRLFAAANDPKEIVTIPGAGHSDHSQFGSFEIINRWIDKLRATQGASVK